MHRYSTYTVTLIAFAFTLSACPEKKKETPPPKSTKTTAPPPKAPPKKATPAPAKKAVTPAKLVEMVLSRTALKLNAPEGTKVGPAIIGGADSVTIPGMGTMVVKPRLVMDKELEKLVPWAKGHQIQKYEADVLKEGKGKTFTYMYKVTMNGTPQVVYHQMFQKRGKDYKCFANAKSEAAARAFKAACDTIEIATEPKKK